jgi:hypothetical protein
MREEGGGRREEGGGVKHAPEAKDLRSTVFVSNGSNDPLHSAINTITRFACTAEKLFQMTRRAQPAGCVSLREQQS